MKLKLILGVMFILSMNVCNGMEIGMEHISDPMNILDVPSPILANLVFKNCILEARGRKEIVKKIKTLSLVCKKFRTDLENLDFKKFILKKTCIDLNFIHGNYIAFFEESFTLKPHVWLFSKQFESNNHPIFKENTSEIIRILYQYYNPIRLFYVRKRQLKQQDNKQEVIELTVPILEYAKSNNPKLAKWLESWPQEIDYDAISIIDDFNFYIATFVE